MRLILNNEDLDLEEGEIVTFKKAQQLNGLQGQYSYSNNFKLKDSSKNKRLLGINYLPNSKAKSMTAGYDIDVVFNGCIYLKRQKLKIQKETQGSIPAYVIFTDSLFVSRAKEFLISQVDYGTPYSKNLINFIAYNNPDNLEPDPIARTAPISAQDNSGLIVVEEVPILLNARKLLLYIFIQMGYNYVGDIVTDEDLMKYFISSNVGVYGDYGTPVFDTTSSVYDYMLSFLKTFNGYLEVNDSSKTVGLYLWKNIETIKANFVDYSDKFVNWSEYVFEGGLAKINTMAYSGSPDFYNGFFNNNKSLVDKTEYLRSDFGAGSLRLFEDQNLEEDGTLLPRTVGETTEPKLLNLFRFRENASYQPVYFEGVINYPIMYGAYSPNISEIYEIFHKAYTKNIALPTTGLLRFRYDAIFLANFKLQEVFFLKQLSTYWLPLELGYTSKKDGINVKCLMIEKTPVDVPVVYDQSLSIGFYETVTLADINALYSPANVSPAATISIVNADLTKNNIYINGVQILAFPTVIDVSVNFELVIENIELTNTKNNSDILFRFTSEEGGQSREAKINVAHNGRANFVSEFRSDAGVTNYYVQADAPGFFRYLNYSYKITTPINIVSTLSPAIGDVEFDADADLAFQVLQFDRDSVVNVRLQVAELTLSCYNHQNTKSASLKASFQIIKNGNLLQTLYTGGVLDFADGTALPSSAQYFGIDETFNLNASAGDIFSFYIFVEAKKPTGLGPQLVNGEIWTKDIVLTCSVTEQL